MSLRGSCHCGRIVWHIDAAPTAAIECNCSICRRRGSILAAVAPEQFRLEADRADMATYTFNRHAIRHQFCKTCGGAPFSEGTSPDGRELVAVNLRYAEGLDLGTLQIGPFDGASL